MKRSLGEFVLRTHDVPGLGDVYRALYRRGIRAASQEAFAHRSTSDFLLRGSLTRDDWIPGLSDVDFFLVVDASMANDAEHIRTLSSRVMKPLRRLGIPVDLFVWSQRSFDVGLQFEDTRVLRSNLVSLRTDTPLNLDSYRCPDEYRFQRYWRACKVYFRLCALWSRPLRGTPWTLHEQWNFFRWVRAVTGMLERAAHEEARAIPSAWLELDALLSARSTFAWNDAESCLRQFVRGFAEDFAAVFGPFGTHPVPADAPRRRALERLSFAPLVEEDPSTPTVWSAVRRAAALGNVVVPLSPALFRFWACWQAPTTDPHPEEVVRRATSYFASRELFAYLRRWRCHQIPGSRYAERNELSPSLLRWMQLQSDFGLPVDTDGASQFRHSIEAAEGRLTSDHMQWISQHLELPSALILQNRKAHAGHRSLNVVGNA